MALSLLGYIQSLFRFVVGPGQVTPGTIISRDCGPGLCCEPLIAHEPVVGSLFTEASEIAWGANAGMEGTNGATCGVSVGIDSPGSTVDGVRGEVEAWA